MDDDDEMKEAEHLLCVGAARIDVTRTHFIPLSRLSIRHLAGLEHGTSAEHAETEEYT